MALGYAQAVQRKAAVYVARAAQVHNSQAAVPQARRRALQQQLDGDLRGRRAALSSSSMPSEQSKLTGSSFSSRKACTMDASPHAVSIPLMYTV